MQNQRLFDNNLARSTLFEIQMRYLKMLDLKKSISFRNNIIKSRYEANFFISWICI